MSQFQCRWVLGHRRRYRNGGFARLWGRSADKSGSCGVCGSLVVELLPPVTFRLRQKSSKIRFKLADVLAMDFDIEVTKASLETSSSGRFSGSIRPAHRPLAIGSALEIIQEFSNKDRKRFGQTLNLARFLSYATSLDNAIFLY